MIAKTLAKNCKIAKVRTAFLGKTTFAFLTGPRRSGFGVTAYIPGAPANTACGTDLDQRSKMIIFESILTTFEASIIS